MPNFKKHISVKAMPNFNFKKHISVKDKVEILIRRYENKFYLNWNTKQLSRIALDERPQDSSIRPRRQEVRELNLLKDAMSDNEFKLVYFIYTIEIYIILI